VTTLNVKNVPDALYRKLQARAKRERRSVGQEVAQIRAEVFETASPPSISRPQESWQRVVAG
jgi:plasmid stability protein